MDLLPRLVHQVRSREQPSTNSLDGGVIRSISWRHNDQGPSDGLTRDDNPTVDHRLLLEPTPRRIPIKSSCKPVSVGAKSSVRFNPKGRRENAKVQDSIVPYEKEVNGKSTNIG